MLSSWLPWILAVVILVVLPVALRHAGDEPGNEISQEQPDDGDRDPGPAVVPLAA